MANVELIKHLFLQLAIILFVCRCITSFGVKYLKQTEVVCEMFAGMMLGPSFLGLIFPEFKEWLFPSAFITLDSNKVFNHPSMSILYAISHIGLVLYMFLLGLEFNKSFVYGRLKQISIISGSGILAPFLLGILVTFFLYEQHGLFQPHISIWPAALYFGTMISITAFPALARMLHEKNMTRTNLGLLAIATASIGDVAAWCLLALVLSCIKKDIGFVSTTILGSFVYIIFFLVIVKNILSYIFKRLNEINLVFIYILIMLGAWIADIIGIYSVFGAFIVGLAMPRGKIEGQIHEKISPLINSFLVPVFFVYSGLNTHINLIDNAQLWSTTILIIIVAMIGKGVFCTLAARATGENWQDSMAIGTLMNCRGLMELIILNIGLENNIITPVFFTIGVIMTIITTLITAPLFNFIYKQKPVYQF